MRRTQERVNECVGTIFIINLRATWFKDYAYFAKSCKAHKHTCREGRRDDSCLMFFMRANIFAKLSVRMVWHIFVSKEQQLDLQASHFVFHFLCGDLLHFIRSNGFCHRSSSRKSFPCNHSFILTTHFFNNSAQSFWKHTHTARAGVRLVGAVGAD